MSIGTYGEPDAVSNAIDDAKFRSWSHGAVIRVYDEAGNVIETHEHTGDLRSGEFLLQCLTQASRRERHFASRTNGDPERVRLKRRVRKIGR